MRNKKIKQRILKILIWTIVSLIVVFFVGLLSTYVWLSNKWSDFYSEAEMITMANEINKAPVLPGNFYLAYDKIYPTERGKTLREMSTAVIWGVLSNRLVLF